MRSIVLALAAILLLAPAAPALAAPVNTGHIEAELVAQEAAVPGGTVFVAVRQKITKDWHTYWRNAGDAGNATKLAWTLPAGWKAGEIVWPTPKLLLEGEKPNQLGVYAYEGETLLAVPVEVPASAKPGQTARLQVAVSFLVCAETCIPEDATLSLDLPVVAGPPQPDKVWGPRIAEALAKAPKPSNLSAVFAVTGGKLSLAVTGAELKDADLAGAWFFPFSGTAIKHADPQVVERGPNGLTIRVPGGYDFTQGTAPRTLDGVLALGDRAFEISAEAGALPAEASGLGVVSAPAAGFPLGLPVALLFAFLGGLILNLMPCVFPILSMKAASLAGHAHEAKAARHQGLAYLFGVVASFVALAGVLIALKAAGAAVGWGFQLQSPAAVAALSVLMLLVALNLSGVFEIGTSLQGVGGKLADNSRGLLGSVLTGVLAVVVAAPCTAPFMGPAMGFALTQSPVVSLSVFAFLGLGLAAPFVALSFAPALLRLMPRPGAWMETLRNVLAFPMYGTAAWLTWVLAQQTGSLGLGLGLAAAVTAAFAAWLFGRAQTREKAPVLRGLALLALLAVAGLIYGLAVAPRSAVALTDAPATTDAKADLPSEPWSPERVAALRAEGRPVFVNFTAAWCVTCQVNDAAAIARPATAAAFKAANAVYLVADWTSRDAAIAAALAEHGRAGVPLYLVYGADGSDPVVLPQLLTEGMVLKAIDKAAKR